jgi:hypothetical protein
MAWYLAEYRGNFIFYVFNNVCPRVYILLMLQTLKHELRNVTHFQNLRIILIFFRTSFTYTAVIVRCPL